MEKETTKGGKEKRKEKGGRNSYRCARTHIEKKKENDEEKSLVADG